MIKPPERRHKVHKLLFPIEIAGETRDVVYVVYPRAGECRSRPIPPMGERKPGAPYNYLEGDWQEFAAKICGMTQAEFALLEFEDYEALMGLVTNMGQSVPPTSASPAPGSRESSTSGATSS